MNHICILTLNRPALFQRCIDSIWKLAFTREVVIWTLHQKIETLEIEPGESLIFAGDSSGQVTIYRADNLGCAGGRKWLVEHIRDTQVISSPDDIFVFLDDDLYAINDTWLDALVAPIRDGSADITGVEGRRVTPDFMTVVDQENPDYVSGGWCAISAKVFLAGIMFDTDFNPNYWEDVDLNFSARAAGFRIKAVGDIGLVHEPHPNPVNDAIFLASRLTFIKKWGHRS